MPKPIPFCPFWPRGLSCDGRVTLGARTGALRLASGPSSAMTSSIRQTEHHLACRPCCAPCVHRVCSVEDASMQGEGKWPILAMDSRRQREPRVKDWTQAVERHAAHGSSSCPAPRSLPTSVDTRHVPEISSRACRGPINRGRGPTSWHHGYRSEPGRPRHRAAPCSTCRLYQI